MKTLNSNQIPKIERPYLQPRYFVHIILSGETLYFSDRNFPFNGHNYEDYLSDIPETVHNIENSGGYQNINAKLTFKNRPFRGYDTLIEFFTDNPPIFCEAEIFVLYIDTGEIFGSDPSTKLHRVGIGEFKNIKRLSFQAELSSVIHALDNKEIFKQINTVDWPYAAPDAVGKYENIVYGSIRDVPCPWVVMGANSTLFADMTAGQNTVILSEVDYPIAFSTSGTIQIDEEKIAYAGKDSVNKTLTGCVRGYMGTVAAVHTRGAPVIQVFSWYGALVTGHVGKAITNVKCEGVRLPTSGYSVNLNWGGKGMIVLTEAQLKSVPRILSASVVSPGSHSHSAPSTMNVYGTSANWTPGAHWIFAGAAANMIDQNMGTYFSGSCGAGFNGNTSYFNAYFPNMGGGVAAVRVCITHNLNLGNGTARIYYNGVAGPLLSTVNGQQKFSLAIGWQPTTIQIAVTSGTLACSEYVYEISLEVDYVTTGAVSLAADTASAFANWIISSPLITCDVEGYKDDGGGTYTGTPNSLIENPSDIRRHFLMALLGRLSSEIGSSFDTARTAYAGRIPGGYKFGMILSEIGKKPSEILKSLDYQSRSNIREEGGKFELQFNIGIPEPAMTLTLKDIVEEPVFNQAAIFEVRDKIRATYDIDWSNASIFTGYKWGRYKKLTTRGVGTKILEVEFPAIQVPAMADDVADGILGQQQVAWPGVNLTCNRRARVLEKGDLIALDYVFFYAFIWKILSIHEIPNRQIFAITAVAVGSIPRNFILMEDGFRILQEDGHGILL